MTTKGPTVTTAKQPRAVDSKPEHTINKVHQSTSDAGLIEESKEVKKNERRKSCKSSSSKSANQGENGPNSKSSKRSQTISIVSYVKVDVPGLPSELQKVVRKRKIRKMSDRRFNKWADGQSKNQSAS